MATQVQFRRGTTSQNNAFIGAQGELTVDTDVWALRIHDGVLAGGHVVPTLTATQTFTNKTMSTASVWNGNAIGLGYGGTGAALTGVAGAIVYSQGSALGLSLSGTSGQLLTSGGTTAPTWVNASALSVGTAVTATTATNLSGGSAGYMVYQQDTDLTGFIAPGQAYQLFQSNGASAIPTWVDGLQNLSSVAISGTGDSSSTTTGVLTVAGGVGIAKNVYIGGDLIVNGSTTTINSTTLTVDDKNIELGSTASPTNTSANGGGITLKGDTDKTIIWDSVNSNWTSSEHWNIASGKTFKIANTKVLEATKVLADGQTSITIGDSATSVSIGASTGTLTVKNAQVVFDSVKTIQIPVGGTADRPTAATGQIRYNTDLSTFEGYGSSAWGSLGGVKSVDGLTYILAETSAGASNDELEFYTATDGATTAKRGGWNKTRLQVNTPILVSSDADLTDFPNAKIVSSAGNTGDSHPYNVGVIGEGVASGSDDTIWGVGVYGVGASNGSTKSAGVLGDGHVSNSSDTGSAVGVRGYSKDTHSGGLNVGLFSEASGSGVGNYALWMESGNIMSNSAQTWTIYDNQSSALSIGSTGKSDIIKVITTDNSEGVTMSGTLGVAGDFKVNTNKFVVTASSGDTTVAGTLGVTGAATLSSSLAVNGATLSTTQTTFNLINTNATTLNIGGASTTTAIGSSSSGTTTVGYNLTVNNDVQIKGNDLTTDQTTFNLLNNSATTVNAFGAATTISLGAATGTVTVNNATESTSETNGGLVIAGGLGIAKNINAAGSLYVGSGSYALGLTSPIIVAKNSGSQYTQIGLINSSSSGSADYVAYGDNGDDTGGWADMGMTGSDFNDVSYTITGKNDGYFFVKPKSGTGLAGNLVLATHGDGTTNDILFATGGFLAANEKMRFIHSTGQFYIKTTADASSVSTGVLRVDGGVGIAKKLYVGNNTDIGGTLAVAGNSTLTGDLAVNGGDITTTSTTATVFNANATTINLGQAATTMSIGATTGTTTIRNNVSIGGDLAVTGGITVSGASYTVNSTNTAYSDSIINLHDTGVPLTSDDGKDIGLLFHYYKTSDKQAFAGFDNDSQYYEYYVDATEVDGIITGTYGTFKGATFLATTNMKLNGSTSGTTTVQATAIAGSTTLTLPAATDTLVGRDTTDTLTNKTLTTPKIASILTNSGSNTVTLPLATDTLVGKATTDTFTNKTFDTAATGNIFKINGTQISANTGTGSNVLASSPTIVTPTFTTSATFSGSVSGSTAVQASSAAGATTLTLPAATDTLVGKATTDTFTNKTFDTAGTGNSFSINTNSITGVTGTGNTVALSTLPTFGGTGIKLSGSSSGTTQIVSGAAAGTSVLTLPVATDTLVGKATTDTFTNKTFNTAGTGNSFSINSNAITGVTGTGNTVVLSAAPTITGHPTIEGVTSTGATGTGAFVFSTSPSLTTPVLGVASATSINKVAITAPATSATLTIADGKTLTASNTLTFTGTDTSSVAFGAGGTVAYTSNKLSAFAATTSAELYSVISDETGTGALVFGTSPAITTSITTGSTTFALLNTTATTINFAGAATTLNIGAASGATTNLNGALAIKGSTSGAVTFQAPATAGSAVYTLPSAYPGTSGSALVSTTTGTMSWAVAHSGTTGDYQFNSIGVGTAASTTAGEIRATNQITSYYSDDRLKTRGANIENALEKVLSLNGFHYTANETAQALGFTAKPEVGLSAQEVQAVLPEVVVDAPVDSQYLTIHYERMIPLLVEAIKAQQKQIEELKAKLGN